MKANARSRIRPAPRPSQKPPPPAPPKAQSTIDLSARLDQFYERLAGVSDGVRNFGDLVVKEQLARHGSLKEFLRDHHTVLFNEFALLKEAVLSAVKAAEKHHTARVGDMLSMRGHMADEFRTLRVDLSRLADELAILNERSVAPPEEVTSLAPLVCAPILSEARLTQEMLGSRLGFPAPIDKDAQALASRCRSQHRSGAACLLPRQHVGRHKNAITGHEWGVSIGDAGGCTDPRCAIFHLSPDEPHGSLDGKFWRDTTDGGLQCERTHLTLDGMTLRCLWGTGHAGYCGDAQGKLWTPPDWSADVSS